MVKILDCTIRDGGHLNNWRFSDEVVLATYNAAQKSGIDYFEIGYRNLFSSKDKGKYYRCTDEVLHFIKSDISCKLCVMADIGKANIDSFCVYDLNNTPVVTVRIAVYPDKLNEAFDFCSKLFDKGYDVFLNLMAISRFEETHYQILNNWNRKNILKALYFADSFGSLYPSDIPVIVDKLQNLGYKNLGFHSHNNLQLAFANTIKAIECGVDIVDATVYGMGRSAGNLPIELLTAYLNKNGIKKFSQEAYLTLIEKYYIDLFNEYHWGYNVPSFASGLFDIHPNYTKSLATEDFEQLFDYAQKVRQKCPVHFDKQSLEKILN